ncbi:MULTISPECIES: hypothetical protein [Haloferax]|uniref:hypothetical protein n=1 Tax=Haloferax TaxID=2251 RepID=UPI001643C642|nr:MULTISPECIES: hypothetical protein [Haloferax]
MVADLGWLSTSVDVPLWGLFVLGGYQRVTRLLKGPAGETARESGDKGTKK